MPKNNPENKQENSKCGFVAIVGAPNAGKSTLMNALVGQKISIVSQKIQTTRFPVRGIIMQDNAQIIFIDTPGVFNPKQRLDRAMVASVWTGARDADLIVHVVDAGLAQKFGKSGLPKGEEKALEDIERTEAGIKSQNKNTLLLLNKIDTVPKHELLDLAQSFAQKEIYKEILFVSALQEDGLEELKQCLGKYLPDSPFLYPEDQASDIPLRLMAAEITREKVFHRLHDELPYNANVETDNWKELKDGSVRIDQTLYVGREGHKAIAIGKNGQTLKWISSQARHDLMRELERDVHLFLHVKVKDNWQEDSRHYTARGLDYKA